MLEVQKDPRITGLPIAMNVRKRTDGIFKEQVGPKNLRNAALFQKPR